jgi:hypothetical protein
MIMSAAKTVESNSADKERDRALQDTELDAVTGGASMVEMRF